MKLPFFIARRYLFTKHTRSPIHIITLIAMIGIMVGGAAMVITLSVFNGLSSFIEGLYSALDPDIKIVAQRGINLPDDSEIFSSIIEMDEISFVSRTIEAQVLMEYQNHMALGTLKGVDNSFVNVTSLQSFVVDGTYSLKHDTRSAKVVVGLLLGGKLRADRYDEQYPIQLSYIPDDAPTSAIRLQSSIRYANVFPVGFFTVQKEYDDKFMLADFDFVRQYLGWDNRISAYELKLKNRDHAFSVKKKLEAILPDSYNILTHQEQHMTLYKVMKNEKYIVYLILTLMVGIAAVNIVGSLSMIVLEKTKDISILKSMGLQKSTIRQIFLIEGMLIGLIGGGSGMALAYIFGLLQHHLGLIKMYGGATLRVTAFPIEMHLNDFILIFSTIFILSILASLYPSSKAKDIPIGKGLVS